ADAILAAGGPVADEPVAAPVVEEVSVAAAPAATPIAEAVEQVVAAAEPVPVEQPDAAANDVDAGVDLAAEYMQAQAKPAVAPVI
ncbi:hypothetical protein FPK47_28365, partial [Acinetobacter baumannii]|nr:hypothetical protein [Acinetobacter baumannii]